MKLTISPTHHIEMIDGAPCRRWEGTSDKGVPVHVWVRTLSPQIHDKAALRDFDLELKPITTPANQPVAYDYCRFVDEDEAD